MIKVVKLILICQIKDDNIPQLIPLIWIISVIIVLYIFLILLVVYFNRIIMIIYKVYCFNKINNITYSSVKYIW